jgi:hypothetical protein
MRQRVLLGILVALVLIVAWVYLVPGDETAPPPAQGRVGGGFDGDTGPPGMAGPARPPMWRQAASAGGAAAAGAGAVQTVLPLRIAELDRTPRSFTTGRNPWRFVEPPPPPPPAPRKPSAAELRAMQEAEAARQRALAEQQRLALEESLKPHPPPFTLSYLGNFGPTGRRIAVFTDGKKVWNAREGDVLEDKFVVAQIGYESVDIRFVGFDTVPAQRLAVKH